MAPICAVSPVRGRSSTIPVTFTELEDYTRIENCSSHVPRRFLVNASLLSCNCNLSTCIAPFTRRPRAHHRVNPYLGARRQNKTHMFSDHDNTSPSIAAVSAPSVACSTGVGLDRIFIFVVSDPSILPIWPLLIAL